jgi:RimJ/RimL family protein N-acetyltransferase
MTAYGHDTNDDGEDFPTKTERLSFAHATRPLVDAEMNDRPRFSAMLSAKVPDTWPPQIVAAPGSDEGTDWVNYYLLQSSDQGSQAVLVGLAGIKLWSPKHRTIQIGTALLTEYHGLRLGEEVVAALGRWGLSQRDIDRVICDIPDEHIGSRKSLERAGYAKAAEAPSVGFTRFQMTAVESATNRKASSTATS